MELDRLRLAVSVARLGSFAAAARAANLDPSAVSRAVASLEAELGARLFRRTTRRLSLTEAGERFLAGAGPALEALDAAAIAARDAAGPAGTLRLTSSVAFGTTCLVPLLPELLARFPLLTLEWLLTDERLDLTAARIDLAVRLGPRPTEGVAARLRPVRYRVVAAPAWAETAAPSHPSDLARLPALTFLLPGLSPRWAFRDAAGARLEVDVQPAFACSSALALRRAALDGLGAALLADWLIDTDLAVGSLVDLFPGWRATPGRSPAGVWLVTPGRTLVPAKVRAVSDLLRARLGG